MSRPLTSSQPMDEMKEIITNRKKTFEGNEDCGPMEARMLELLPRVLYDNPSDEDLNLLNEEFGFDPESLESIEAHIRLRA